MLKGEQILDEVRDWIGDPGYSRFVEINQAYKKILRQTKFSFLRKESTVLLSFSPSVSEYTLDMSEIRVFERLLLKGGTDLQFDLIEEVPPMLFEQTVNETRDKNGNDTAGRPKFFKIGDGPQAKITVTPVPDVAYTVRVDYIQKTQTIDKGSIVNFPEDYSDMLSKLAAGYILQQSSDPTDQNRGVRYVAESMGDAPMLVRDAHPNRTFDIDRQPINWIK